MRMLFGRSKSRDILAGLLTLGVVFAFSGAVHAEQKRCHPDGQPTEDEVYFQSSGGSYGAAIEKAFFEPFEKECGIDVTHVTGARNFAQLRQLVASGTPPWDIGATVSDQEFPLGLKDGLFEKLPDGFWDKIKDEMIPGSINDYGAWAAPYSDVIVYSTDLSAPMNSWADFWDTQKFPGARMLQNSPMTLVMALLADGVDPKQIYPLDLDRAFKKLDQLRPAIRAFWTSADQPVQGVANGEFAAGSTWNGRVARALSEKRPVAMTWNGALLHTSYTFILKGAQHKRAAEALLYFMQRADRQAELAKLTGYTGGNKNVVSLVDPEVAKRLPASPENVALASVVNAEWWAEHIAEAQARWDAWLAK